MFCGHCVWCSYFYNNVRRRSRPEEVTPGLHTISNGVGMDTQWPKEKFVKDRLTSIMREVRQLGDLEDRMSDLFGIMSTVGRFADAGLCVALSMSPLMLFMERVSLSL